jgi:hypothetical protein
MKSAHALAPLLAAALAPVAAAQMTSPFQTPGMNVPQAFDRLADESGQFDNSFNPAIGFVLDAFGAYSSVDVPGLGTESGGQLELRTAELALNAWVDPNAWAYGVVVYSEDEVALEEGAVHYVGLPGNATLRAGRFFVDFGKQMQSHVHDLNTFDRPLVLREYLGTELGGDGVQWDHWTPVGDATALRWSVGMFGSLGGGHGHGEEDLGLDPEPIDPELKKLGEFAYTGRLTGFTDVGDWSTLQLGASGRFLPDVTVGNEDGTVTAEGLSNVVWGLDATWGWTDETATQRVTFSGEFLRQSGDFAEFDNPGSPTVVNTESLDADGWYAYGDYAWNRFNSAGLMYSSAQHLEPGTPRAEELDLYYTRNLSEFGRLRLAFTLGDDGEGGDSRRVVLQYTNYIGAHAHGVNF